jgi:hypothetical protein
MKFYIVLLFVFFTNVFVSGSGIFIGVGNIGNVFHYAYDPYNETFIIPSATKHQIFIFKLKTNELFPIVGTFGVFGNTTNVPGAQALLYAPSSVGLVYSRERNKYPIGYLSTDYSGHCIRYIDAKFPHFVTTVAGNCGTFGTNNGIGTNAYFKNPFVIALDRDNFRYGISDYSNGCIRLLTINNKNFSQPVNVSTIAGICGNSGFSTPSGNSLSMQLSYPTGITFIPNSNVILISEPITHRILRLVGISSINGGYLSVINYIWSNTYLSNWYVIPPQNRSSIIRVYITSTGGVINNIFTSEFNYDTIENITDNQTIIYTQLDCTGSNINMRYTMTISNGTMYQSYTSSTMAISRLETQSDCNGFAYDQKLLIPQYSNSQSKSKSKSNTQFESESRSRNVSTSNTQFESESRSRNVSTSNTKIESESRSQNISESNTKNESGSNTQIESKSKTKIESESQIKSESKSQIESKSHVQSESNTKMKIKEKTITKIEIPKIVGISQNAVVSGSGTVLFSTMSVVQPTLLSNVVRFRSINKLMSNDETCKRDRSLVPDITESPTQIYFPQNSSAKYFNGIIVGNITVIIGVSSIYCIICYLVYTWNKKKNTEMIFGKFLQDYYVFDVAVAIFTILVTPIFIATVIIAGDSYNDYPMIRATLVCLVMILTAIYFILTYIYIFKKENIHCNKISRTTIFSKLFKEESEWEINNYPLYYGTTGEYISILLLNGYKKNYHYFAFIDNCMLFLFGIPEIIANYVNDDISCNVYALALTTIIGLYLLLLVVFRPMQPAIVLYTTIFCLIIQFGICIAVVSSYNMDEIPLLGIFLTLSLYVPMITPITLIIYDVYNKIIELRSPEQIKDNEQELKDILVTPKLIESRASISLFMEI